MNCWMCKRNTIEAPGIWKKLHNPDFKGSEFETFHKESTLNSYPQDERRRRFNEITIRQLQTLMTAPGLRQLDHKEVDR